jgi:MFS family permease
MPLLKTKVMDSLQIQSSTPLFPDIPTLPVCETPLPLTLTDANKGIEAQKASTPTSKDAIRTSLKASTIDGLFAAVFSISTTGILLSNFLVELDASPMVFGMLSSIPMLVNLIQPLGAIISERTTSRFWYSMWTYGTSRLVWLMLPLAIIGFNLGFIDNQQLVTLTLSIILITNLLGGLGNASWLSWLAMIVPRRLRGRYFGIRNSVSSLTNLVCVPLAGLFVSKWSGGAIQGYGIVLLVGILFGVISLLCQHFKIDINPQQQNSQLTTPSSQHPTPHSPLPNPKSPFQEILKDSNFLVFLAYFSFWMFAVNLSTPFFNLYMLENLKLDVSWVTLYSSLQAAANLLMMILWGRLADKIGNRPVLFIIGILVAITPLLWLGTSNNELGIWLWLPLLHIFLGGTLAGLDLCNNNLQLGVAAIKNQSTYFAIAAAASGVSGAIGTTIGGFIAQNPSWGGLTTLFIISSVFRLFSLTPLFFVQEGRGLSFKNVAQKLRDRVFMFFAVFTRTVRD